MPPINRRRFLAHTLAAGAAASLPTTALHAFSRRRSANDDIRIGVAGIRSRGGAHINGLNKLPGVKVVALCDVDETILTREAAKLTEQGGSVATFKDIREMLDGDQVDAVSLATPNHWHALGAIWACQAGKDVYVEKPVSHNVWEGRKMVEAAERYGRIVQTGTQARSSRSIIESIKWVQEGNLGAIKIARGICYKPRQSIGKVDGPQTVPDTIDYNLWTGPAPLGPLMRRNLHYDWHWVFDTGCGDLGNQGVHQMDICRWALGYNDLPPRAVSVGGRFGYIDDGNTPNTQVILLDYKPVPIVFEVRGLPRDANAQVEGWGKNMDRHKGMSIGAAIECEDGYLAISSNYGKVVAYDNDGAEVNVWEGAGDHFANFIDAVRSRKPSDLNSDILEGHLSSAICHLGNISYLAGQNANAEEIKSRYNDSPVFSEALDRMAAHLDANNVNLDETYATAGVPIEIDVSRERIIGNDAANALLTRRYREPFVVPERV